MKKTKLIAVLLSFVMIVLVFAGCGGNTVKENPTTESGNVQTIEQTDNDNSQLNNEEPATEDVQSSIEEDTTDISDNKQDDSTSEPTTEKTSETTTEKPTQATVTNITKKGNLYKAYADSKIWAGILGDCYLLLRNIDSGNEWGEKGQVYELHVSYVKSGEDYGMWSDGYWKISEDGTQLTLTPKNQSDNGNIGVTAGQSKTFTAVNGVFEIPITFEQGGKTTIYLDVEKNAL